MLRYPTESIAGQSREQLDDKFQKPIILVNASPSGDDINVDERAILWIRMHRSPSSTNSEILFEAIRCNEISVVIRYIKCKLSLNVVNGEGMTPLIYACYEGCGRIVEFLLDHGAKADGKKKSPLTYAIIGNSVAPYDIVKLLLDRGAIVDVVDREGKTPLMHACERFNFDIMKLLINHGASITNKDHNGFSPLMYACNGAFKSTLDKWKRYEAFEKVRQCLANHGATFTDADKSKCAKFTIEGWNNIEANDVEVLLARVDRHSRPELKL